MKARLLALVGLVCFAAAAFAQTTIVIPAGTPEDKDLATIANEADAQKRTAFFQDFVQKYASNPAAVAYGNAQLAQIASAAGDNAKALDYGDKALAAMPDVIDNLQNQVNFAQAAKRTDKVVEYAGRGATVLRNLDKQPKPASTSDADWQQQLAQQKDQYKTVYEFFEAAAYNSVADTSDPKQRLQLAESYLQNFPGSKFTEQVTAQAIISLQESKDTARLAQFADKAVTASPNNAGLLIVIANALSEAAGHEAKASTYAHKAIELSSAKMQDDANARKTVGVGHSIVGYVLLKENKFAAAVPELKTATGLLKDDPDDLAAAWFRLGFAYVKLNQAANATAALKESAAIPGPYQPVANDLIAKIKAARAGGSR